MLLRRKKAFNLYNILKVLPVPLRAAQFLPAALDFLNQQLQLMSADPACSFFQVEMKFLRILGQNRNSCTADPPLPRFWLNSLNCIIWKENFINKILNWKEIWKAAFTNLSDSVTGFKGTKMPDQCFKMIQTMETTNQFESKQLWKH